MTDSLKFGPEWLRQLSQDNSVAQVVSAAGGVGGGGGGGAPHRYQLAEHRYGREEMLALFDRLAVARSGPDLLLHSFPALYVEKAQLPLALVQMTEEETRTWQRGINSESVLRGPGKMGVGGPGSLRGAGGAGGMGRGGVSMDRGVRGRGRGNGGFYTRGAYEEEGGGDGSGGGHWRRGVDSGPGGVGGPIGGPMTSSSFNSRVTRSFDRSQGGVSERGWGERNGTVDANDWNGSTSPRKDFGRGLMENWRARGSTEEEDTWRVSSRTEKWGRNNWREGGSGVADRDQDGVGVGRSWEGGEGGGSHHRGRSGGWEEGGTNHRPNLHRHSWEESDKLPEWATENLSESGGSFDASGAFHGGGGYSDEDEKGHGKDRPEGMRRLQQSLGPLRRNSGSRTGGTEGTRGPILLRTVSESEADHIPSTVPGSGGGPVSRSVSGHMSERSASSEVSSSPEGSKGSPMSNKKENTSPPIANNTSPPSAPTAVVLNKSSPPRSPSETTQETQPRPETARLGSQNKTQSQSQVRASSVPATANSQINSLSLEGTVASLEARGQQRQRSEEDLERMQEVADDLVAKLMDEEEDEVEIRNSRGSGGPRQAGNKEDVGVHREEPQGDAARLGQVPGTAGPPEDPSVSLSEKWFYQDPQGIVQGPFGSGEMADWFRAGYFNTTLLVRRACDECFSQLGDLIKHWGCIPFAPGPSPPPLKAPMTDPAIAAASAPMPLVTGAPGSQVVSGSAPVGSMPSVNPAENLLMQQYQYQLIQRELFMRQQAALQAVMEKLSVKNQQSFVQQLMTQGSQGQQPPPQGPQQAQQNPPHQPQPHHTSTDGMAFIQQQQQQQQQQPFKMQSDLAAQKNPVMALINQFQQQAKVSQAPEGLMAPPMNQAPKVVPTDQISQLIQHIAMQQQQQQQQQQPQQQATHQPNAGVPHHQQPRPNVEPARPPSPVSKVPGPGSQQPPAGGKQDNDPFQSILRLLEGRSNGNPLAAQSPVESVWGGPFAVQNWLAQAAAASGQVSAPPGQHMSQGLIPGAGTPLSLWDLQGKDVKTEQQILEEQMRAEEERKKEELRKQEEAAAKKKVEEEERKRKQLEEELRRKEEERRRLEEQMRQLEEEKRAEEQRRKEEEKRIAEERRRIEEMKQNLIAAEEKKIQEAKRLAEKQRREEAEERKRKEEEKARKLKEEEEEKLKKKQEEEKKKQQQIEENNRKMENQRRQLEAQRKAQEVQQNAAQAAAAAAAAAESNAAASQRPVAPKSQAPWAQQQNSVNMQNSSIAVTNLAEIQRMQEEEKEKLVQKMREKEIALAQAQAEKEHQSQVESVIRPAPAQQAKSGNSGTSIQLKWADKRPQPVGPVKSLAEIQAEEHEQQLAREREKAERAAQQAQAVGAGAGSQGHGGSSNAPGGGIWGSGTQSLTWAARSAGHGGWAAAAAVGAAGTHTNHSTSAPTNSSHPVQYGSTGLSSSSSSNSSSTNSSPAVWATTGQNSWATNSVASNATSEFQMIQSEQMNQSVLAIVGGGGGFWEEPAPALNAKVGGKQGGGKAAAKAAAAASTPAAGGKGKGKSRKDEVMKIFEQNVQRSISAGDEFTQWCLKTLGNLQTSVDIPTFVGFLKDIDSPYEVSDYVRSYLGDGKEAREFARSFLERRSRWRNAQKAAAAPPSEDDMCIPAPAVNPLSSEFQEVKGKGKKAKKNKMLKLDNRILGFSVTASHDRINVGDRDYGEGV